MDHKRRINEHRLSEKKFDSFRLIKCENLEIAARYELRWIRRFKPKYNGPAGRPLGEKKQSICIYIDKGRAAKLRNLAHSDKRTISIIVENALEGQYGL